MSKKDRVHESRSKSITISSNLASRFSLPAIGNIEDIFQRVHRSSPISLHRWSTSTVQRACGRTLCRSRITKTRQERDNVSCKVRGRDNRVSKTSQKRANLKLVGLVGVFVLIALHVTGLVGYVLPPGDTFPLSAFVESLLVRPRVLAHVRESVHCGGRFSCLKIR